MSLVKPNSAPDRVTQQQVWSLAWPMILSNLSTPLLGIVDTIILGHLPQATDLAAVALGATLITFVYWSLGFLRMGTTGLVARAEGQQDDDQIRAIFWRSIHIALMLSLLLWLVLAPCLPIIFQFLTQPGEVRQSAQAYAEIRIWSAPMVLINYVIIGWFVGRQNTRLPLLLTLVLNFANIILDIVLVWHLNMGSTGAAWATFSAELIAATLGIVLVLRALGGSHRFSVRDLRWSAYKAIVAVNSHLFVRTAVLLSVLLFFSAEGAKLGDTVLAANAILMQLIAIISYGLDGFAHAAESLVGRAAGTKNKSVFMQACRATSRMAFCTAIGLTALLLVAGANTVNLFSNIDAVREVAGYYYWWMPWFPLVSMAAYQLDGIFIGWGRTDAMQVTMILSALLVFFPVWAVIGANTGLWTALLLFNASRGLLLYLFLHTRVVKDRFW